MRTTRFLQITQARNATVSILLFITLVVSTAGAGGQPHKTHLDWAKILVRELRPEETSYQHKQD